MGLKTEEWAESPYRNRSVEPSSAARWLPSANPSRRLHIPSLKKLTERLMLRDKSRS